MDCSTHLITVVQIMACAEKDGWLFVNNGQCYCPKHTDYIVRALQKTAQSDDGKEAE